MVFHVSVMLDEAGGRLDEVSRAGFHPEIRMNDAGYLLGVEDAVISRLGKAIADRGLTTFVHGPFLGLDPASLDARIADYSARCLERGLEAAEGLGATVMVIHTSYSPRFSRAGLRQWLGNWSGRMAPILDKARRLGVTIALENVWEERPEELERLLDALPDPGAMVCLDTGHVAAFSRLSVGRWWERLGDRVVALHLHDNDGLSDDHLPPGEGVFDFPALAALLRQRAHLPFMTLEVERPRAAAGRRYLEGLFGRRA